VRGKVAVALAATVGRLCQEPVSDASFLALLRVAAKLVEDNTPEAREGARTILAHLRTAYFASGPKVLLEVCHSTPVVPFFCNWVMYKILQAIACW
jgi:hypothetical protein